MRFLATLSGFLIAPTFRVLASPNIEGVNPYWKDVFQIGAWVVAIGGGLIAAARAIDESRANREQRKRELRWRQAQAGTELVGKMLDDSRSWNAMIMLDWDSREYALSKDVTETINIGEVEHALRPYRDRCTPKEAYIRDAFDTLFYHMALLERAINVSLVTFDDVSWPISYYVQRMATHRRVYEDYMREFSHSGARNLAERFEGWRSAASNSVVTNESH